MKIIITVENKNKRIMILTGNNIGEEGAKMISDALKRNTTLTTLGLASE